MSSEQSYAKRMMNVPGGSTHTQPPDYLAGHRDACHACADIAAQADADLAALREQLAAKDARIAELEAVVGKLLDEFDGDSDRLRDSAETVKAAQAALAALAANPTTCPGCGGEPDNGYSRDVPPKPYYCSKCEGER